MQTIAGIPIPKGRFYGPCSGRDLPIAFDLFGNTVDHFTFCDLSYKATHTSAVDAVPDSWRLVSRVSGIDEASTEKTTSYARSRPFRPRVAIETWRRPDGSDALVELRCDLAEDLLIDHFTPRSISVFMHINDGTGEGGSDLWFLASPSQGSDEVCRDRRLLSKTAQRLCNGGIVLTDGVLADRAFRSEAAIELAGSRFEFVTRLPNLRLGDRPLAVWRHQSEPSSIFGSPRSE